jgi:hypothetical protein
MALIYTTRSRVRLVVPLVPCSSHYDNCSQDRQIHFGHPIIASTCKLFYFDKWSDVSTFDRDTFHGSVPEQLVALVGAVVRPTFHPIYALPDGTHSTGMFWTSGLVEALSLRNSRPNVTILSIKPY